MENYFSYLCNERSSFSLFVSLVIVKQTKHTNEGEKSLPAKDMQRMFCSLSHRSWRKTGTVHSGCPAVDLDPGDKQTQKEPSVQLGPHERRV